MKRLSPRLKAELQPSSNGWHERCYSVLLGGALARLESDFDINAALQVRREQAMAEQRPTGSWPPYPQGTRERIVTFGNSQITSKPEFEVEEIFPKFDQTAIGNWLIADSRCGIVKSSARFIDEDGKTVYRLLTGDGIDDLQCDPFGNTWVGYFDEGIFGNNGWGLGGPTPIGATGINCFNSSGEIVWPQRDAIGQAGWPLPFIADCYTLNVAQDAVWICPYTDFPIVKIGYDRSVNIWSNDKIGADLLAVDGDFVVLLGGYGEEGRRGRLLRLVGDVAQQIGEFEIDVNVERLDFLPMASGRESALHFVVDGGWYELTVQDIANELA